MHTHFGFEIAISVFAAGRKRGALNPGLLSGLQVDQFELVPLALHPARVHAEEHVGPVLGLGAAGARIDGDNRIAIIVFAVQHDVDRKAVHAPAQLLGLAADIGEHGLIVLLDRHLQEPLMLLELLVELFEALQSVADGGALFQEAFGLVGGVPKTFAADEGFEFRQASLLARYVKDSPGSFGFWR